jgi:class 3 adenylate cyclase/tetratricopeptide (TPR) repeat protein
MRFCGECGSSLDAESSAPPPAGSLQPAAERRLVSVLFADLVGFTPLSERRDAEEVRDLLSRYFDTSRRLIELYGGTVEKFIGDAVMAVWGAPTATEDDAERAVRAALDLVAAVSALGAEIGEPDLRARGGVLTGEAAVTLGADVESMVAGDLVNTAARVQSVAEPGAVYVGDATRRATEQTVVYEDVGSFELKGKQGLVPLWRAQRVVSGARGTLKSQGLEAPFVGRDRELRQIKDLFHASEEERKAHLVSITGVAGIGKSRLSWEFYKYFDGLVQTVFWHRGRCLAYGEGVTYWALADMVRMRCRIGEDEQVESALAKLHATVEAHVPDPDERRFVEPRLAQLIGLGDSEAGDRQELFAAWRLFFERLADEDPCVLAFEDMQWADASLLDFIEYLLEWSRNSPIFVLALARPELTDRRPTWGAGLRNFSSLYLEPLPQLAMEELLGGLVPGLPPRLRDVILARAEGVPLYAVETVRMLLDRGALVREGSVYRPVGEIDSLEVPETLNALIGARLDGLDAGERRIVQDGAVLGKTFAKPALSAVTGLSEGELEPLLASLVRKELLGIQSDPRSPEQGQYGFLQDLVRHVAYERLSKRERRARHLVAAEHLSASLGEDEVAEVVASHLMDAYRAAPDADDAEAIKERARAALARAGERAASLGAPAQARHYLEQAAALTDDPLAKAELADRAGQMAWNAGHPDEARALFRDAESTYAADGQVRAAARISARLAEIDFSEGHPGEAVARLEPALAALSEGEPDADLAALSAQLGRFLTLNGEPEKAVPHLEFALQLAESLELHETLAEALNSKATGLAFLDRLYEGRVLLEGALELALEHELNFAALRAYNNLADLLRSADRFAEALAVTERGLELARRLGVRNWEGTLAGNQNAMLTMLGRWDEAERVVAESEDLIAINVVALEMANVIHVRCERGDVAAARALIDRHLREAESAEDAQLAAIKAMFESRILRAEGRLEEALAAAQIVLEARSQLGTTSLPYKQGVVEALESATALGSMERVRELVSELGSLPLGLKTPFLAGQLARFRARLALSEHPLDAGADYTRAAGLLREVGLPFHLAVVLLEHGEALIAAGQPSEAGPLVQEARELFGELGARPWLERTAEAAASLGSHAAPSEPARETASEPALDAASEPALDAASEPAR